MSKCGPNTPREEPFEDRIDSLFRELELSIQWQRPSILFAIYSADPVHSDAELALEGRLIDLGQKIFRFQIKTEEDADVAARLARVDDPQETVFFVSGLECGGGEDGLAAYAALNKGREFFIDQAIRVVFWLTENEAVNLANVAPDYWAYRHRVIEFVEAPVAERPAVRTRPAAAASVGPDPVALAPEAVEEPQTADLLNSLGEVYLRLGRHDDALQAYGKAVEAEPRGAHHWNGLGNVHFKMGAYDEAIAAYEKAVALAPDLGWSYGNLGLARSAKGQPDQAVPLYLKSVELLPGDKEKAITWNRLGDAYRRLNDRKHAMSAYQKAFELDAALKPAAPEGEPDGPSALEPSRAPAPAPAESVDEWRTEIEDKNTLVAADVPSRSDPVEEPVEPSQAAASQAIPWNGPEEDPMENELKTAAEWNARGHSHMSAGDYDEAIKAYTRAIELAEELSWPYIQNLARAHYHKGEHKAHSDLPTDAEDAGTAGELASGYEEPPTQPFPELAPQLAQVKPAAGQEGHAGHSLKEAVDPEPVPALVAAIAQPAAAPQADGLPGQMGDWLSALEDEKTATVNRSRPLDEDWLEEARRKFGLGEAGDEAVAEPQPVQPQKEDPPSLEDTAQVPVRRMKATFVPDPAPAVMEELPVASAPADEASNAEPAVTWDEDQPRDAMEWNERGNICLKAGACDRAIDAYIKAIESAPDFGWPYSNLGLAYSHKGKYAEAIPLYRKSIELLETKKEKAIAWNRMGDAYRRLNDHKSATAAYQKAVELDSGTSSLLKRVRLSLLGNARV